MCRNRDRAARLRARGRPSRFPFIEGESAEARWTRLNRDRVRRFRERHIERANARGNEEDMQIAQAQRDAGHVNEVSR